MPLFVPRPETLQKMREIAKRNELRNQALDLVISENGLDTSAVDDTGQDESDNSNQ